MCNSLSEEGAALKVFISKLQSQLSDSLSEANGLRGSAKSLEAKVFELMSEVQMYRGQIDELQVFCYYSSPQIFSQCVVPLTYCSRCFSAPKTSSVVCVLKLKPSLIVPSLSSKLNFLPRTAFCLKSRSNFFRNPILASTLKCSSRIRVCILQNLEPKSMISTHPIVSFRIV